MNRKPIFSPTQVGFGALFGPISATYFLWRNFKTIGKDADAKQALLWGAFCTVACVFIFPYMSSVIALIAILLCYALFVRIIVEKLQFTEKEAATAGQLILESNIKAILVGVGGLVILLLIMLTVYFALYHFEAL